MKQVITIELSHQEWLQAIADYLKIPVEDIESSDFSTMKLELKKPL